jgi:hypothetical protein
MIAEGTLDELRASVDADGATLETVFLGLTSQAGRAADSSAGCVSSFRPARFAPERA